MALADALISISDTWSDLRARFDPSTQRSIRQELAAAVHTGSWDPNALLAMILANAWPEHPAWEALDSGGTRRSSAQPSPTVIAAAMRLRYVIELTLEADRTASSIDESAEERILVAPCRAVSDVPSDQRPGLLVLSVEGSELVPEFQLRRPELRSAVLATNRALEAGNDPWGAASWWLAPHAALDAIPSDGILSGIANDVVAAARAALAV